MVSFNSQFPTSIPAHSYGSPSIDQPGGQDGWILAEFLDLFYYQINLFIYFISYFYVFFMDRA